MWLQQRDLFGASLSRKFGQEQKRGIKREVRGEEMETYSSPFDLPFLLLLLERSHHREFRHLTKPRPRQQRERQKTKGLMSKTTTLHVHHAFLYLSLPSLHNYDVKWPNFKFTWERERQGDKFYHLCPNLSEFPSLHLQPKFPSFT